MSTLFILIIHLHIHATHRYHVFEIAFINQGKLLAGFIWCDKRKSQLDGVLRKQTRRSAQSDDFATIATFNLKETIYIIVHKQHVTFVTSTRLSSLYAASGDTPGPEIIALMTPLPSSLFPARVALNAAIASSKANLIGRDYRQDLKPSIDITDTDLCVTNGFKSTLPCATRAIARGYDPG